MELGINHTPHEEGSSGTSSGSPESINGLKFGQKIYFEEVGIPPNNNGGGSTVKSSSSRNSNSNGNNINGFMSKKGQTPRCQVEGCKVDLSDAKAYYSRHKVCVFHSKSPMVVVSGLEQRFCQQCSRFHQLPEFDQGKRSCRRRLAGHNERRRKPSPGSLMSSRLGRLSSSFFGGRYDDSSSFLPDNIDSAGRSGGGFLLDFSSYPTNSAKELWPDIKPSERVPGNPSTSTGRHLHNIWPGNNSEDPPQPKMFRQGGSSFSVPPGECITGVSSDSTCALSLLSNQNQTWSSNNSASSNQLVGNLMNANGAPMSHCTGAHVSVPGTNHVGPSWGFKDNEPDVGYQVMPPPGHLGPAHVSHPVVVGDQFHGNLLMEHVHNEGRQYMEVDHSIRSYNSSATGNVHWSLF